MIRAVLTAIFAAGVLAAAPSGANAARMDRPERLLRAIDEECNVDRDLNPPLDKFVLQQAVGGHVPIDPLLGWLREEGTVPDEAIKCIRGIVMTDV